MHAPRRMLAFSLFAVTSLATAGPATEFWAVPHGESGQSNPFTIAVGNPDPSATATMTIETELGVIASGPVPPLGTARFDLGYDRSIAESGLERSAYRVRSDIPIHAYQWHAFDPFGTSSAAILIDPTHWGKEYIVLAARAGIIERLPSVVTVVATGPARVEVVPTSDIQPAPGVPALPAGTPAFFDLNAFDVLQLASFRDADLTGTLVRSSSPVEVFAGCHGCVLVPSSGDHVQEWIPPVHLWTQHYVAASTRGVTRNIDFWRVIASADGTSVTTQPPQPGTPAILNRGEWLQFESSQDFEIFGSAPILAARYNHPEASNRNDSDPAMAVLLPPEWFSLGAVFPLSTAYSLLLEWLDIVAPAGANVTVDGAPLSPASFRAIGAGAFLHAQVALDNTLGTHVVASDLPIGIYPGVGCCAQGAAFPAAIDFPPNLAPACDPGGPYSISCQGPTSRLRLSGAGSSDPESQPLSYSWSSGSTSIGFDDGSRVDPEVTATGLGMFTIDLQVSDGVNTVACAVPLTVTGSAITPPELDRLVTPLWLVRRGADILFSWQDLGAAPILYNVYDGAIGSYWSHVPSRCGEPGSPVTSGRREAVFAASPGNAYFVMSASSCFAEGPSGADPALSICPP